jgi:hypothetical protein
MGPHSPGPANSTPRGPLKRSGQVVNFTVTNNNNSLFSTQPAVSLTGTLTYTPANNCQASRRSGEDQQRRNGYSGVDTTQR